MFEAIMHRFPITRALGSRSFALLFTGQTISVLGDTAFDIALTWEVLLLTHSAAALGIVLTAEVIPRLLFLLVGGVVADRLPRRLVLLWSDAGRASIVFMIAILGWMHLLQLWHFVVLALFFGLVDGFFTPAYQAIFPQLVEVEFLSSANALKTLGVRQSRLLGALLGAGFITLVGPMGAFAFDGLTFVASALCLVALRLPKESASQIQGKVAPVNELVEVKQSETAVSPRLAIHKIVAVLYADIREGLSYVIGVRWLLVMILIAAIGNIVLDAPISLALPKLVLIIYGLGIWMYGALRIAGTVGGILGILLIGQVPHLRHRGILANLAVIVCSGALIIFGFSLPRSVEPIVSICANILLGFGLGVFQVLWATLLQEFVPSDKLGRVNSIDALGSYSLFPIGYLVVGTLIDRVGPQWIFLVCGSVFLILACLALCLRSIRQLD